MQKSKILAILSAGLLLSNIVLVVFIFTNRSGIGGPPPPGRDRGPRNIIIERLHFNKEQTAQYDILIDDHRRKIDSLDHELKSIKNRLYNTLDIVNDTTHQSLMAVLATVQSNIEVTHYQHFLSIGRLCMPQQKEYYHEFLSDVASLFGPQRHKPRK